MQHWMVKHWMLLGLCLLAVTPARAMELRIAVAANFTATLERLAEVYGAESGVEFSISSGASGKHFAQISQGAPFDVFFSADDQRTADLVASGHAVADSRLVYARGVLVLWSPDPASIPDDAIGLLQGGEYRRLAIANPRVAPYGAAAEAVMQAHGIEPGRGRLVTGQSIGQTFNFVTTGNADFGFVALSQVIHHERQHGAGSRWTPDPDSYPAIIQEAVLLGSAREPQAASAFLDWVGNSETARAIIEADGYRL